MADYEATPYVGFPIPTVHPRRLDWTSFVFGGPRPDLARARVLEIGCGDGATLLPIAAWEPSWTVHGVDASPRAISAAEAGVRASDLANATFARGDVAGIVVEPATWDVVIAHGLYSWIDPERRAALRRLIRRALAPNGLAAVSFNALPAWGVRGRVRDVLVRHGDDDPRGLLDRLTPLVPDDPWGRLLAHELERARAARGDYLAHEYLAEHNAAFWVGAFGRDAAADGLRWIGDAQFDLPEGCAYEAVRRSLGLDGMAGEELADLLGYRQFRCAVLARDDAPGGASADDAALLETAIVAGAVAPVGAAFTLGSGVEESARCSGGLEIVVTEALAKAALGELARIHPDGLRFPELAARARRRLAESGMASPEGEEQALAAGILRVWRAGGLELRLHRPNVSVERVARPAVPSFGRYEASMRPLVSSPLGVTLPLEPVDRAIVRLLDGSRTEQDAARELAVALARGAVPFAATSPDETGHIAARAAERVDRLVTTLARWGVLRGA